MLVMMAAMPAAGEPSTGLPCDISDFRDPRVTNALIFVRCWTCLASDALGWRCPTCEWTLNDQDETTARIRGSIKLVAAQEASSTMNREP
jgi:transposase-like protein